MPKRTRRFIIIGVGAVITTIALWTRWMLLDVSLWGDEAYSAQFYINRGPAAIFRPESFLLNNHVFFSFGEWAGSRVLGTSEVVPRLGADIPALGAIVLLGVWAYRRFGAGVALTISLLLVDSPVHLLFSTQARGYGLGIFVAAALLVTGVWVHEQGTRASRVWLGVAATVGIITLPHLAFLYAGHLVALVVRSGRRVGVFANGLSVPAAVALFFRSLLGAITDQTTGQGLLRSTTDRPTKTIQLTDFVGDPATLLYDD
jgi:hypothetical protein